MYSAKIKIGKVIAVYGARPSVGASTLAAMTASLLAAKGDKTLLLSTDPDIPFDAISMLSDEISENHMDELVALENSTGIDIDRFQDYVTYLTDNLGYIRASANLNRITKNPSRTMNNIIDAACYSFTYVVVDIGYASSSYATALLRNCDLIVHALGQDAKSVSQVAQFYGHNGFGEDMFVVPIVMGYLDDLPADLPYLEKKLGIGDVFAIYHDDEVYRAGAHRKIANFVYKGVNKKGGLFGFKKKKDTEDVTAVDELAEICGLITDALTPDLETGGH